MRRRFPLREALRATKAGRLARRRLLRSSVVSAVRAMIPWARRGRRCMARNTERASSIFRAPRMPRTMKRSSSVRGSRLHASTICSSEQIHLRGISRFIAVVSRQAAISRAAESCLRESWFTRRRAAPAFVGVFNVFLGIGKFGEIVVEPMEAAESFEFSGQEAIHLGQVHDVVERIFDLRIGERTAAPIGERSAFFVLRHTRS